MVPAPLSPKRMAKPVSGYYPSQEGIKMELEPFALRAHFDEDGLRALLVRELDPFFPNPEAQMPLVLDNLQIALTDFFLQAERSEGGSS